MMEFLILLFAPVSRTTSKDYRKIYFSDELDVSSPRSRDLFVGNLPVHQVAELTENDFPYFNIVLAVSSSQRVCEPGSTLAHNKRGSGEPLPRQIDPVAGYHMATGLMII